MTPEDTGPEDQVYSGIIHEYISLAGGRRALVIIDGGATGMKIISVDKSRIISLSKDFPVGREVEVCRPDLDAPYIFRKPEAT